MHSLYVFIPRPQLHAGRQTRTNRTLPIWRHQPLRPAADTFWPGLSLCWLPVRLDCNHLFCIRCMIKMQNQSKKFCPLCRSEVIQKANESMCSATTYPRPVTIYWPWTDLYPQHTSMTSLCATSSSGSPRRPGKSRPTTNSSDAKSCLARDTWTIPLLRVS